MIHLAKACDDVIKGLQQSVLALQQANFDLQSKLEAAQIAYQTLAERALEARQPANLNFDVFDEDPNADPKNFLFYGPQIGEEERVSG